MMVHSLPTTKNKKHTYLLGAITSRRPDGAGGAAGRMKNGCSAPVRDREREGKCDVSGTVGNRFLPGNRLSGDDGRRCWSEGATAARGYSDRSVLRGPAGFEAVY